MREDNSIYNKKQPGLLYLPLFTVANTYFLLFLEKDNKTFSGKISSYFRFSKKKYLLFANFIKVTIRLTNKETN